MASDSKKIIEALAKIVNNQQKIIRKLAQAQGLPPDSLPTSQVGVSGGHSQAPAAAPPAGHFAPNKSPAGGQTEGQMIHAALPASIQKAVSSVDVPSGGGVVNVAFAPGGATQANYDAVVATIKKLQNTNPPKLPGKSYQVKVV
jgi:hypothetical protein